MKHCIIASLLHGCDNGGMTSPASKQAAIGPLNSESEARALPAVRAVWEAFDKNPGVGKMAPHNRRMLAEACEAAGVELGAYDAKILDWLSQWEPQTCAVIAGLIGRAHSGRSS